MSLTWILPHTTQPTAFGAGGASHGSTLSRYDRDAGKWAIEKAPAHHVID